MSINTIFLPLCPNCPRMDSPTWWKIWAGGTEQKVPSIGIGSRNVISFLPPILQKFVLDTEVAIVRLVTSVRTWKFRCCISVIVCANENIPGIIENYFNNYSLPSIARPFVQEWLAKGHLDELQKAKIVSKSKLVIQSSLKHITE